MSKAIAGVDRTVALLLGLVLIALGVWPILIYFNVEFARYLALWVDHDAWANAPRAPWWQWALAGTTVACAAVGVWLIVANVKVRRILRTPSAASNEEGTVTLQMNAITEGMAKSMAAQPGINKAERKVAFDRGRPQLTFIITAAAETGWAQLRDLVCQTEADFRAAFPDSELETVYKIQHDRLGVA